ncbi:MAG: MerR family transcriptional regulator [Streptosporangiaceae bacterium]
MSVSPGKVGPAAAKSLFGTGADRTPGGQRDYPDTAIDRVIHIQELFAAGLHSKKIAQLLPCMRDADGGPSGSPMRSSSLNSPPNATASSG